VPPAPADHCWKLCGSTATTATTVTIAATTVTRKIVQTHWIRPCNRVIPGEPVQIVASVKSTGIGLQKSHKRGRIGPMPEVIFQVQMSTLPSLNDALQVASQLFGSAREVGSRPVRAKHVL